MRIDAIRDFFDYLFTMEPSDLTPRQDAFALADPRARRAAEAVKTAFWMGMAIVLSVGVSQLR